MNGSPRLRTRVMSRAGATRALVRARLQVLVEHGALAGTSLVVEKGFVRIGSSEDNDIVLPDDTVSKWHAEVEIADEGFLVRDRGSTNGTWLGQGRVMAALVPPGTRLRLGSVVLQLQAGKPYRVPLRAAGFAGIDGESLALRECLAAVERAAASDSAVLLQGETGSGKERFARALHLLSSRRDGPLEVLDCGSLPEGLAEAELFGVAEGAFTGASASRPGLLERASGGTLFLDEVGELPEALQPKLLRVMDRGELKRVGSNETIRVDLRVVAATHRNLETMVAEGVFRAALFYRLSVLSLQIPPLRQRKEDIPALVQSMLEELRASPAHPAARPDTLALFAAYDWPGNVRELQNVVQRMTLQEDPIDLGPPQGAAEVLPLPAGLEVALPYHEAKERSLAAFEKRYVRQLLDRNDGSVVRAAQAAGIPRQTLRRIIVRAGLDSREDDD